MAAESRADVTSNTVDEHTKQEIKAAALEAKRVLESTKLGGASLGLIIIFLYFMAALVVSNFCYAFVVDLVGWEVKLFAFWLFLSGLLVVPSVKIFIFVTKSYLEATRSIQKAKDLNIVLDSAPLPEIRIDM